MKKLIISLILCLSASALGQGKPMLGTQIDYSHISGDPVGAWFFLEGSGNKVFDLSGNGNDGTLSGPTWVPGKFGLALLFGTNKHISLGTPAASPTLNVDYITIVCWIKVVNGSTWQHIYGSHFSSGAWLSLYEDESLSFYTTSGGQPTNVWNSLDPYLTIGKWAQVVAVFAGDYKYLYINGELVASKALTGAEIGPLVWNTGFDLRIGEDKGGSYDFLGEIDNLLVCNRALSASEVSELYWNPFRMFEEDNIALLEAGVPVVPTGGQVIMITSLPVLFIGLYICRKYKAA